jgi:hypothetical protein
MQPLSQQLSELSAHAKKAEDRVAKAQSEAKEQFEQQREEARRETEAALNRVDESISRASEGTKTHLAELKAKTDADMQRMRENASERTRKFEAWQASNYATDKAADAQAAIGYAVAAIKIAEVATLDAIDASGRAEIKTEQAQPIQA